MRDFTLRFLASGAFISYIPARLTGFKKFTGSGLAGTALALLLVPLLPEGDLFFTAFLAAFAAFSVWVAGEAEKLYANHDDPRIVIDEIAGYWTAILLLPRDPFHLLCAFVLFRAFDSLKPWPIRRLEAAGGGFGIIMDDVAAGVMANLLTRLAAYWYLR